MLLTASDMDPAFEASVAHTMVGLVSLDELRQFNLDERCLHGMVWVSIQEHNSNSTVCHVNHHGLVLFEIREGASIDCSSVILYLGGLASWTLVATALLKFLTLFASAALTSDLTLVSSISLA